ncbi:probable signal recognition particle 19 kDa protein [Coccomyxa sp. Obi]|nr:probable signal recognition particle 19 kDa protein [Coccomyxa sp. Obi]
MNVAHDKRVIIYPAYIDAKKTIAGGRKITKQKACENPTAVEIVDCCNMALKLQAELEDSKAYSRDFLMRGRARVKLFNDAGTPINPAIPNRKILYERVAELCPRHPGRSKKAQAAAAAVKQQAAASSSAAAGSSKSSTKSGKKKRK